MRPQRHFYVAQALAGSQLSPEHDEQVIPTAITLDSGVAVVFLDHAVEHILGQVVGKLGKNVRSLGHIVAF